MLVEVLELFLARLEEDTPSWGLEPRSGSEELWLQWRGKGKECLATPSSSMCSSRPVRWEGLEIVGGARKARPGEREEEEEGGA